MDNFFDHDVQYDWETDFDREYYIESLISDEQLPIDFLLKNNKLVDWTHISKTYKFSFAEIEQFADFINYELLAYNKNIPIELFNQAKTFMNADSFVKKIFDIAHINSIYKSVKLTENNIRKINFMGLSIDWEWMLKTQKISFEFILENLKKLGHTEWDIIFTNKCYSKFPLDKFLDIPYLVDWEKIIRYYGLTKNVSEFLIKHIEKNYKNNDLISKKRGTFLYNTQSMFNIGTHILVHVAFPITNAIELAKLLGYKISTYSMCYFLDLYGKIHSERILYFLYETKILTIESIEEYSIPREQIKRNKYLSKEIIEKYLSNKFINFFV